MRITRAALPLLAMVVATTGALLGALPAQAAPITTSGPGSAKVVVSNDHFHPGERILLNGQGFSADPVSGSGGLPVLAVKVNDNDEGFPPGWNAGGADYVAEPAGEAGSVGYAAFAIQADGTFSGWIDVGTSQSPWETWLRFLGGSLTTVEGGQRLPAMSFKADISIISSDQAIAKATSTSHLPGGELAIELRNFQRADSAGGQKVAFKIDGAGDVLACVQTDAEGDASAVVPIPESLSGRTHELNVLAGTACGEGPQAPGRTVSIPFQLTEAAITSTTHTAGGTLTFTLGNFLRASGLGGQKVALKIDGVGDILKCVTTNAAGDATDSLSLPADLAVGSHTLNVLAGSACGAGAEAPARSFALPFNVTAPQAANPTVAKVKSAKATKKKVVLVLTPGTAASKIVIASKGKVKLAKKAKAPRKKVKLAKGSVGAAKNKVSLKLTAKGLKALRSNKTVKVTIKVTAKGAATHTKTLKLRLS